VVTLLPRKIRRPERKTFLPNYSSDCCSYSLLQQLQEEVVFCATATYLEACLDSTDNWGEELDFANNRGCLGCVPDVTGREC